MAQPNRTILHVLYVASHTWAGLKLLVFNTEAETREIERNGENDAGVRSTEKKDTRRSDETQGHG